MRATKAYLASLGTTGLLVLSSVLVLVLGSAFVGFNGWPGGSGGDGPESVVVQSVPLEPEPDAGPEEVAAIAAPAAEAVAEAASEPPAQAPVPTVRGNGERGGDGSGTPTPPGDVDGTPRPAPGPGVPNDPTDTPPPPPPPPPTLVDGLADGGESTTTYLGQDVVGQLSPDLGTLLTQTGQGLTDLVRALDGTPPPPR
jgi:hypothetical protein